MYRGYQLLFWGIFSLSFHLNLGNIRILPAFLAWVIVLNGISRLNESYPTKYYDKAKLLAQIAILITLIYDMVSYAQADLLSGPSFSLLWPVVCYILELLVEYYILSSSVECLEKNNYIELRNDYVKKIRYYSLAFIINIIVGCVALTLVISGLSFLSIIFGLILRIIFMGMMSNLKHVYEEDTLPE